MRRSASFPAPAFLCAVLSMGLAACQSAGGPYPSLAVRDVERAEGRFESTPSPPLNVPPVPVELSGTLAERLGALSGQARASHERFLSARSGATRLAGAAAGAGVGSDAWASAQVALSDLDSIRSQTAVALADLDILSIAAAVQAEDRSAIEAVRGEVAALIAEEDSTLETLRARIR